MTDRRGRHGLNFDGVWIRVSGEDKHLDLMLDDLEYVLGVNVENRIDTAPGEGTLLLHGRALARPKIIDLSKKYGLVINNG